MWIQNKMRRDLFQEAGKCYPATNTQTIKISIKQNKTKKKEKDKRLLRSGLGAIREEMFYRRHVSVIKQPTRKHEKK